MPSPHFEIVPSERIEMLQDRRRLDLEPDRVALNAMAQVIGVNLPETLRMLLLDAGQHPNTLNVTLFYDGRLPRYESENDLVVNLLKWNQLDELTITASIARALVNRKRDEINRRGMRIGKRAALGSVVVSAIGEFVLNSPPVSTGGAVAFVAAVSGMAYFANRSEAPLPVTDQFAPPVRTIPRDEI